MDNKPISDVDTLTNSTRSGIFSIALNSRDKHKRSEMKSKSSANDAKLSKNAVLLVTSFKKSIKVLATALKNNRNPVVQTALPALISAVLDNRIDKVKAELKNEIRKM